MKVPEEGIINTAEITCKIEGSILIVENNWNELRSDEIKNKTECIHEGRSLRLQYWRWGYSDPLFGYVKIVGEC